MILALIFPLPAPAFAETPTGLTWDEKTSTLAEIAKNTGYDMVNSDGSYKPLYYHYASELWQNGLLLGSDGSFDLNKPLTRAEGVVMTIRILGKDAEAKATTANVTFTDVPDWAKPYVAYAVQNGIANGYSSTTFGSGDPMTAAQFITLSLRAMGYKDNEDFSWDKSYDKALDIGLIGQGCHTQYSRSNLFLRDNAAMIAYNAVFEADTKAGGLLKDTMAMPGTPSGSVPTATRVETPSTPPASGDILIEITNVIVSRPSVKDDGMTERGEILVDFTILSGSGDLKYSITGHSGETTEFTCVMVDAGENYRVARKYEISQPFTPGAAESFVLTWSGGGVERTIRIPNTNMHNTIKLVY
ncbi:S-layer homology domain-containing protein [Oscillospiraceae bacterium OttesenSCG-928-F05]|nr:S-layer homology domain-containing protein [Oscillospiraceae bacterium OttesenSCG-928-F05]